jgi:hypothetical protein
VKEKTPEQEETTTSGEAATNGEIVKDDTKEARRVKGGQEEEEEEKKEDGELNVSSPDPYYPPIIYLPEVVVNSGHLLFFKGTVSRDGFGFSMTTCTLIVSSRPK